MPLINTSVPNLIQGVSQQPAATRFDGQCDEQENALSSVAEGLKKRPNTRHIARLMTEAIDSDSFVHFIDRSEDEKYVIIQSKELNTGNTVLKAFNAKTGSVCTINGSSSILLDSLSYLSSNSPNETTKALTIADTTFLNNNTKTPQLTNNKSSESQKEAIVVVIQGDYSTNYVVKLSSNPILTGSATPAGVAATFHTTGQNSPQVTEILPATIPPRYELVASQYGSTPTNSPLASGGDGYDANNSQINVESNGSIIQLPSVTSTLGTGNNSDKIVGLNLINSGEFEAVLSGSSTLNLSIAWSQSENGSFSNNIYNGTVTYTMQISGNALINYNAAGRPTIDVTLTGNNFPSFFGAPAINDSGGILEYRNINNNIQSRAINTFSGVQFSSAGYYQSSKNYNSVSVFQDFVPLAATNSQPSSWTNATYQQNVIQNSYIPPTITLSAGTPASTQGAGTAESNFPSSSSSRAAINTDVIATGILNNFSGTANNLALFVREQDQNLLLLRPASPTTQEFFVSTSDGLANTGLQLLYKEVGSVSNLPVYCKDGFKIKIQGDPSVNEDDYYVEFQTNDNATFGTGVWKESIGFGINTKIDANTMPHGLINVGLNEFVFGPFDGGTKNAPQYGPYTCPRWADRAVGDDDSNPISSFIGTTPISSMTLFKNRLCFVSGNNVSFSEAGQFFNFSRTTVRSLLDSAPIDVSVSSPQVTDIKACVPYQGSLLLFADNAQLKLAGGDILSPRTVSITPVTQFAYQSKVEPLVLGSYIYYPFNRGSFSGINEFYVNATTDTFDATEITEHVPFYISRNINLMASSTSENYLVVSNKGSNSLYIYTFFWNGNQKLLSSWSKFTFADFIHGINFIDSNLNLVMTDANSNTHLVSLPLEMGLTESNYDGSSAPFLTLLDKRVRAKITSGSSLIQFEQPNGTYSSANANHPYAFANNTNPLPEVFVGPDGVTHPLKTQNTGNGSQVFLVNGNASSNMYGYVGIPYTMKYKFSTQVFKASAGNSTSPTNASKMHVRNGTVFFSDAHKFNVKVNIDKGSTATSSFNAINFPESEQLGDLKFAEGSFRFPVYSKAKNAEIVIENDNPFDSKFSSAEFESFVHMRSSRYG